MPGVDSVTISAATVDWTTSLDSALVAAVQLTKPMGRVAARWERVANQLKVSREL
eukprot:SAG31_NODE_185_length_20953_cov_17.235398_5_plen_55_part_00